MSTVNFNEEPDPLPYDRKPPYIMRYKAGAFFVQDYAKPKDDPLTFGLFVKISG
jgi:hypothetical protein